MSIRDYYLSAIKETAEKLDESQLQFIYTMVMGAYTSDCRAKNAG